ncbi:phytanoyl-CoA dioxygenase family protein [Marinobacterium sp. YM272]|uniref:phytanoyl-CoA dioxygenase family protein n=1 Tax=Marinobacterium sp. YM272 TaxID=3421654 RepID=UPI003D7F40F1
MQQAKSVIGRVLRYPYWFIELFTWAKSFKQNPIIGNYWLNRCGLHVARVVVSQGLFRFRLMLLAPLVAKEDREAFLRDGYILKRNFLERGHFLCLKAEAENYQGLIREFVEGTTLTQRAFLTQDKRAELREISAFTDGRRLDRLMRWCSSKNRPPFFFIENLCNHANVAPQPDPQRDFHTDTFHPCVKGWLFLDAADNRNGPHVYVPGSHRLTWKRLKWEYRESLEASKQGDKRQPGRYWDGSFRATEADLAEMGLEAKALHVPENTLLIGNVYGFHRRGVAEQPSRRMTIWMQARDNPFNPLFTPFPRATAWLFEKVWQRELESQDPKKIAAGTQRNQIGSFDRDCVN